MLGVAVVALMAEASSGDVPASLTCLLLAQTVSLAVTLSGTRMLSSSRSSNGSFGRAIIPVILSASQAHGMVPHPLFLPAPPLSLLPPLLSSEWGSEEVVDMLLVHLAVQRQAEMR